MKSDTQITRKCSLKDITSQYFKKKFICFFLLYFSVISIYLALVFQALRNFNGVPFPYSSYFSILVSSIILIFVLYPLLNRNNNWLYKGLILYLGMIIFLFIYFFMFSFFMLEEDKLTTALKDGFFMAIFGQLISIWLYLLLSSLNWIFKDILLE